jgi:outer membrane immunogenic protein
MKNKGFLLASSVGVALAPGAGLAADMAPAYKAPPQIAPAASWTGFYMGVHGGAAWQLATNSYADAGSNPGSGRTITTTATSAIAGGQIGYNWQQGSYVFGLEADGSWLSKGGSAGTFPDDIRNSENKIRWLSTARVRTGLVVADTMAYVTGGVAFGGVRNCLACGNGTLTKSESKTRVGWAIGGGIEHMISRNWTFGLEGMFVDLGRSTAAALDNPNKTTKFSNQAVIGRAKLNYKF